MDIVIRAAVVYFVLLLVLRVTTRRVLRSATPLDLLLIFMFGGLGVQAVLGNDTSATSAVLAMGTFAVLHVMIVALKMRWPKLGLVTEGAPTIVYRDGEWDDRSLQMLRMARRDVVTEIRQGGLRSMDQVEMVIAEHNGGISVIEKRNE
jgi:uncharacterized membrane protein YcaP (DUF421 family)